MAHAFLDNLPRQVHLLGIGPAASLVGSRSSLASGDRTPEHHCNRGDLHHHAHDTPQCTMPRLLRLHDRQHFVVAPLRHEWSLLFGCSRYAARDVALSLLLRRCGLVFQPLTRRQHSCVLSHLWVWALVGKGEMEPLSEETAVDWYFTVMVTGDAVQLLVHL